jgi:methionyl-tRNA synthetase
VPLATSPGGGTPIEMTRQILVTNALPYVNGDIHLGHLVEHIQTDVWVRFQRMRGHEVRSFCGDDAHGTATMIRARQQGREPEALLEEMNAAHQRDLAAFGVFYDHYGSTHSPSNQKLVNEIWRSLREAGHVAEREVTQLFDPEAGIFLADRFVKSSPTRSARSRARYRSSAAPPTSSSRSRTSTRSSRSGPSARACCSRRLPTGSRARSSASRCETGT